MYWPAWYWNTWLPGNCSVSTATSGARRSIVVTRTGIFSTGNCPTDVTCRDSITQSVCGVAQQVRTRPDASSAALSALSWCAPWMTRPSSSRLLQDPQAPSLQP